MKRYFLLASTLLGVMQITHAQIDKKVTYPLTTLGSTEPRSNPVYDDGPIPKTPENSEYAKYGYYSSRDVQVQVAQSFNDRSTDHYFNDYYRWHFRNPTVDKGESATVNNRKVFKLTSYPGSDRKDTRAEISTRWEFTKPYNPNLNEQPSLRWYAAAVQVPGTTEFTPIPSEITGLIQIHTELAPNSPPVQLGLRDKQLLLLLRGNHDPATPSLTKEETIYLGEVTFDTWYCFYAKASWSGVAGHGDLVVWLDKKEAGKTVERKQIYRATKMYNTYAGNANYLKAGYYFPGTLPAGITKQTVYTDALYVANAVAGVNPDDSELKTLQALRPHMPCQ